MDLPDIEVVVQWKATCTLCSMWQRFGRGARGDGKSATAVLLFDKKDLHGDEAATESGSLKRKACEDLRTISKRPALASKSINRVDNANSLAEPSVTEPSPSGDREIDHGDSQTTLEDCRRRFMRCDSSATNTLKGAKARGKRPPILAGSAMDSFINPPAALNCRRMVVNVYFGNDKACDMINDHHRCDPILLSGCPRCAPKPLLLCCDICHPDQFASFGTVPLDELRDSEASDSEVETGKSRLKPIDMTSDKSLLLLKEKLFDWRDRKATERFGPGLVATHGSHMLMGDPTIDRIITCAKAGKLPNVARLITETKWRKDLAELYGPSLLTIIHDSFPDQYAPKKRRKKKKLLPPAASSAATLDTAITVVPPRNMRCGECGRSGHNHK